MSRRRNSGSSFLVRFGLVAVLGLSVYWAKSFGLLPQDLSIPGIPSSSPASASRPSASSPSNETNSTSTNNSTGSTSSIDPDAETIVERVVDGDTLVITGGERIRLIGVDTPETKHPTKPPQPFGKEAYEFTRRTVEGKRVQIKFDPRETKDRYGRTLGYVYVDGEFLNELLLRQGLARAMLNYPFSAEMKTVFRNAEAAAKTARRGVWSLPQEQTDVTQRPSSKKAG